MTAEQTPASTGTTPKARLARGVYLAALGVAIVWLAATRRTEALDLLEQARPARIAAALAATFVLIALSARFWVQSLRMQGHQLGWSHVALATARALPARYVPLGVGFASARIALLRNQVPRLAPLVTTAVLETVMRPAVALTLGTVVLAVSGGAAGGYQSQVAALAVAAVAAIPVVGRKALARLAARRSLTLNITLSGYARLVVVEAAYWAWASMTFVLYLRAFPAADSLAALQVAGAFMVAWALGFLAVFAPQGIGVAEIGLVALLVAGNDESGIAMAAVFAGYRLVQAMRDILATVGAEVIARYRVQRGFASKG